MNEAKWWVVVLVGVLTCAVGFLFLPFVLALSRLFRYQ